MKERSVSKAMLSPAVSLLVTSPLTEEQAARLMVGADFKTPRGYVEEANRRLSEAFGLPWRRGRTFLRSPPVYTRDEMVKMAIDAGIEKDPSEAGKFVDNLLDSCQYLEGCRGFGFYLTDDWLLGTRYAAFMHLASGDGEKVYMPVIHRDNEIDCY